MHLRQRYFLEVLVLLLLGAATFGNSLFNGFNVDDSTLVLNNAAVHGISPGHLRQIFLTVANGIEYLPVRDLTYAIDFSIWGSNPFGFHLANLLYYLLTCMALLFLLRQLAEVLLLPSWFPFAVTCLFMLHPVHVESVASIANRKDILSGGFVFLACHAFLLNTLSRRPGYYLLAFIFYGAALFSKGTVITVPFLLLLMDLALPRQCAKSMISRHAPFFAASGCYFLLQSSILKKADIIINAFESSLPERLATAIEAIPYYLKLLLAPYPLIFYRQFPIERDLISIKLLTSTALVALLAGGALMLRRKKPAISFFIGWFLVTIVPVVGLLPTGTVVADRYLFLPSVAFCALIVIVLTQVPIPAKLAPIFIAGIIGCTTLAYTAIVVNRNRDWRDSVTLFEANLRQGSREPFHYLIIGRANFNRGRYAESFSYYAQAAALYPPFITDMNVMKAFLAIKQNDLPAAAASLEDIRDPEKQKILDVAYLYGMLSAISGNRHEALLWYQRALQAPRQLRVFTKRDIERGIDLLQAPGTYP